MAKELKFSYNWNKKLDCNAFTSLRLSGRFNVGDEVNIKLIGKKALIDKGLAICKGKKRLTLDAINEYIALLDTGYSSDECKQIIKRMYPKINQWDTQPIYFYLFQKHKAG